ncbi:hypothetical protein EDD17DRAFT_1503642 [Pisolithus thermaeus]|nr:hypothetical protein EV401DRAFT_2164302 [Pisolithus croceorrhizus]KAI6167960.1 hypothetical protein EDD17DRAFT_1503642 [Pisolithus thermaeus]
MPSDRNKTLPAVPLSISPHGCGGPIVSPLVSAESALSISKALPAIKSEETLSEEEMDNWRDHWNESVKETHVYRKRQLGQHMQFPVSPIFLADATDSIPATPLSASSQASSTSRSHRRWGFLKRMPTSKPSQKGVNVLESFRCKAQQNIHKRLTNTVSTLDIRTKARNVALPELAITSSIPSLLPHAPPTRTMEESEVLTQEELMADKRGVYLTLDPDWQISRGEAMLSFLSPIPQDYDPFRPDSPILHRHRSLCDLVMLAQKPFEEPKADNHAETFIHSIDELHSFVLHMD